MSVQESVSRICEIELVERLRSGDPEARVEFYNAYRDRIYAFVLRQLGVDEDMVEDIVQDTFFAALESLDKFRGDSQLYTWLNAIADHKVNDLHRHHAHEAKLRVPAHSGDIAGMEWGWDTEPAASSNMETEETNQTIFQAIDSLPKDYRQVLMFKYIGGMPVLQISRILGRSPKSVEGLLSRARRALRNSLEELDKSD